MIVAHVAPARDSQACAFFFLFFRPVIGETCLLLFQRGLDSRSLAFFLAGSSAARLISFTVSSSSRSLHIFFLQSSFSSRVTSSRNRCSASRSALPSPRRQR